MADAVPFASALIRESYRSRTVDLEHWDSCGGRRHPPLYIYFRSTVPATCNSSRQHHLDHFRGDEPIQPEIGRLGQRMGDDKQPTQPADKEQNLGEKSGKRRAPKALSSALKGESGQKSDEGICQKKSAGCAE